MKNFFLPGLRPDQANVVHDSSQDLLVGKSVASRLWRLDWLWTASTDSVYVTDRQISWGLLEAD